jgi:CHASE2 domain-containing sensor protein
MSSTEGIFMLQLLLTVTAGLAGYVMSRNFVRNRLRFVDAIHSAWAPLIAGAGAFVFAWPLALLPLVSVTPAVVFGIGTGLGTASGARLVRRGDDARRRLTP